VTHSQALTVAIQVGAASLWPSTAYKACQTLFICMKWTWYVYEVDRRSQSQPYSVVSSQMWHTARPWQWPYRLGWHPYDHPLHIKYAKHLLYVWSGPDMCMKWIGGPNHNRTVWLVPRCETRLDLFFATDTIYTCYEYFFQICTEWLLLSMHISTVSIF
jgi:hypothetical protein